ncbi:MAG: apolipoprotein N-acyltransferase [Egibacteraceae bacterium]
MAASATRVERTRQDTSSARTVVHLRRGALAVAGGGLLYAGHPPLDLGWTGLVALVPLLSLARDVGREQRAVRAGLAWGLLAGLVFFGPLLSWLFPFGVIAWVLLMLIEGASLAGFVAGVGWWGERRGRAAFAVVLWVALEALRSAWPLGGFGWGVLGYTQHAGGLFLPVARSLGVLGVSAVLAALAACVEEAGVRVVRSLRAGGADADAVFSAARTPLLVTLSVLVAAVLLAGEPPAPSGRTLDIAAVQASETQFTGAAGAPTVARLDPNRIVQVAGRVLEATRPLAANPPTVTIWPENTLDDDYTDPQNTQIRATVAEGLLLLKGNTLIADALLDGPRPGTLRHALVQIAPDGSVTDLYMKRKLVPFGEYVPFRRWLGGFPPLEQIPSDQIPGNEPGVFDVVGARIGMVICYENLSPELVYSEVRVGADVLVVTTNNTSFGHSPMSRQHLAISQLRAVETGRWVLHAGLSGISGIIDPQGGVHQRTVQFEQAIVRDRLPLVTGRTPAILLARWLAWAAVSLASLALVTRLLGNLAKRPRAHDRSCS